MSFAKDQDAIESMRQFQSDFHVGFKLDYVIDGDTIVADGIKIRLWGIDAPEKKDKYYLPSKMLLESMLSEGKLTCLFVEKDRYKRHVMVCHIDGRDIGSKMVQVGMAKDYSKYSNNYYQYEEALAKAQKIGIWSEEKPHNPYQEVPEAIAMQLGKEGYDTLDNIRSALSEIYDGLNTPGIFSWGDLNLDIDKLIKRYKDRAGRTFIAMDDDQNGKLVSPDEVGKDVLAILDINKDGFVTKNEMEIKGEEKALRKIGWQYKRMFALDLNNDGFVSLAENLHFFEKYFPLVDLNDDKVFSEEENKIVFEDYKLQADWSSDIPYDFDFLKEKLNYTDKK